MATLAEARTLRKLEDYFEESVRADSWKDFVVNGTKAFRYKENDQWTTAEKSELDKRRQPHYINNQVKITIDRLTGQFSQLKSRIGYRPRNPEDQQVADILTDIYRYIYQNNQLEFHERECAEDGFTCGRGVLEVHVEFDDNFQPEIKVQAVDVLSIHPDPKSRHYDWNADALYICRSKWIDLDEAVELYPKKAAQLRHMVDADPGSGLLAEGDALSKEDIKFIDNDRKRLRLVEVQYKQKEKQTIWLPPDGEPIPGVEIKETEARKQGYYRLDRIDSTIRVGVFTQGLLLEDEETEKSRFGFVQYLVHRKKSGEPYSMILPALPLQDSINKRGSKALHLLNSNRAFYERSAVTGPGKLAEELARPDGLVELNDGKMENFKVDDNRDLAVAQMAFHDSDLQNFRRVTGVNPDALGEKSEIRSGIGIARKVAQTETVVAGAFDNFRRTRVALAETILDCVQNYYTPRKILLITDKNEAAKVLDLNPDTLQAAKQRKYDVVVDELPNLVNTEEEQFQTLAQMLPNIVQFGPFWMRMLIKASNLRDKDEFVKALDELPKGPSIQPKLNISAQLDNMGAPERAYLYQQMGAQELAQVIMQENRPPADQVQLQTEQLKLQGELQKIQAEIQQAQLELQIDERSAELEMMVESKKADAEVIKAKIDIAKAQLDLEKKRLEIDKVKAGAAAQKAQAKAKPHGR